MKIHPYHVLPSGSRLILKQELTIPAHSAGVWLQGGRVMSSKDINQYHPTLPAGSYMMCARRHKLSRPTSSWYAARVSRRKP